METKVLIFIITGLSFLLIFLFGFRLNKVGIPYSTILVTAHKLIGLGLGVYLTWNIYEKHLVHPLTPIEITATAVTVILFAVNTATGSLLSAEKPMPPVITTLNKIAPYFTILSTTAVIILVF